MKKCFNIFKTLKTFGITSSYFFDSELIKSMTEKMKELEKEYILTKSVIGKEATEKILLDCQNRCFLNGSNSYNYVISKLKEARKA